MAKSNDPLAALAPTKGMDSEALLQLVKDQHEHMVRMQQQINELLATPRPTLLEATSTSSSFEDKVWESVLVAAVSTSLNPSRVTSDTPKAMEQMITRALRIADHSINAAKTYKEAKDRALEIQAKSKTNDPLRELIDAP